jgi:hypothetical protein
MSAIFQIFLFVLIAGSIAWLAYRFVQNRLRENTNLRGVKIDGLDKVMKSTETLEIKSIDDFIIYFREIAASLAELGLWEAESRIKNNVEAFEAPMGGYYQRMAIIVSETLDDHNSVIPPGLKKELEIGYNTCAKLCGVTPYDT